MDASEPGGGMRFGIRDRGLSEAGATAFGALTRVTVGFVTLVAVGSTDADGGAFECGGGEAFPDSGGRGITSLPWHFGQGTVLPPNCSPTRNGAAQCGHLHLMKAGMVFITSELLVQSLCFASSGPTAH